MKATLPIFAGFIAASLLLGCKSSSFGGKGSSSDNSNPTDDIGDNSYSPDPKIDYVGSDNFIPEVEGCGAGVNFGRSNPAIKSGRVVLSHDVNIFSTSRAGEPEARFALNVVRWLTVKNLGRVLVFESKASDQTRNFSQIVRKELNDNNFTVDVISKVGAKAEDLVGYDAVFVGVNFPNIQFPFNDPTILVDFVKAGGGLYLYSGVGTAPKTEAAKLNPIARQFGFEFTDTYNQLTSVDITSKHPIFTCISKLGNGIGHNMKRGSVSVAGSTELQSAGGHIVFAAYGP